MNTEQASDAAVATIVRPRKKKKTKPVVRHAPKYHVVLWDDPHHTYEYVIRMVQALFGRTHEEAYQAALEVDTRGQVILLTTTLEHAELKRDQIRAFGKDVLAASSTGSMFASVEAAP